MVAVLAAHGLSPPPVLERSQRLVGVGTAQPFAADALKCAVVLQLGLCDPKPAGKHLVSGCDRDGDVLDRQVALHHLNTWQRLDELGQNRAELEQGVTPPRC